MVAMRWPVLLLAVALPVGVAAQVAQEVSVRAYLTPGATVGVGAPFVLNVELSGTRALDEEPELPDLSAYAQYQSSSTQSSVQMVNGRTSVTLTVQYRYQAVAEGTFEIPSIPVRANGEILRTEPIRLTVSADAAPVGGGGETAVGPDDVFITASASKERVRQGEPFVLEYRIWTRVDVTSFNFTRVPEPEGFWVEDITPAGQPQVEQLTRDGEQYATAVIRRVALVPTTPGERAIEPIVMEAQVRVRSADPFDRFFGGRSLFGGRTVPVGVVSDEFTVDVLPLPAGAPEPFSGIVGALDVTAELDRDSVAANEAVTLTVRVGGEGNLRAVTAPELELPDDFEVFPPEASESIRAFGDGLAGAKTFEYVLIPRAPGNREVPAISLGYFDPEDDVYRVASSDAIPLRVTGVAADEAAGPGRSGVAELRRDIRFIHLGNGALRPQRGPLFGTAGFWLFFLLPLVGIAGAVALRRHQDLLEGDVAYARGRRAGRVARKRLAHARELAAGEDRRGFYAEVARALRGLVADRLNLAEAGLQTRELVTTLERERVAPETVAEVEACLVECDRQRFAPPGDDPTEASRVLERVGNLMGALDRELR